MRVTPVRRRSAAALALLVAATGFLFATATPASAAPGDNGDDGEGGSRALVQQLESASRGFVEAEEALNRSRKRQGELVVKLRQLETELGPRQAALDEIVQRTYRTGRLGPMTALITSSDAGSLLDRAQTLELVAVKQDAAIRELRDTRDKQAQAKAAIDAAVKDQRKQVAVMAKRKAQAETALKAANQGTDADGPGGDGGSSKARAAPRSPDGSLPGEGCTVDDPTSGGCITPRLLNAMQQAQEAGFDRYVHCFRPQNSGEHPKGRACDFASDRNGFGGDATGSSKRYGDSLAGYFIDNSSRLGVLYVIWFRRIWLPSSGWKSYSGAGGDPSSDHTNHVHLSVR